MDSKDLLALTKAYVSILEKQMQKKDEPPCPCKEGKKCLKKECPCKVCKKAKGEK